MTSGNPVGWIPYLLWLSASMHAWLKPSRLKCNNGSDHCRVGWLLSDAYPSQIVAARIVIEHRRTIDDPALHAGDCRNIGSLAAQFDYITTSLLQPITPIHPHLNTHWIPSVIGGTIGRLGSLGSLGTLLGLDRSDIRLILQPRRQTVGGVIRILNLGISP